MFIAQLIQQQLVFLVPSGNIGNDLRIAGNTLPCIVFEIDQDVKVECITNDPSNWTYMASVRINCFNLSTSSACSTAHSVNQGMHGQVWSSTDAQVLQCNFIEMKTNYIEDGSPGLNDKTRVATLSYQIIYKDLI